MSDRRIVQCFGVKRRPRKQDKDCRRKFIWTARGASAGNFGSKGVQACPHCGTSPDFRHPFNRFLNREMTEDQARAAMPAYEEEKKATSC